MTLKWIESEASSFLTTYKQANCYLKVANRRPWNRIWEHWQRQRDRPWIWDDYRPAWYTMHMDHYRSEASSWQTQIAPSERGRQNQQVYFPLQFSYSLHLQTHFIFYNIKYLSTPTTAWLVTGDWTSPETWYFHRTTVKQRGVWYFGVGIEPGCLTGLEATD